MKLDILAIGSHPDDVELGCSGTLLAEAGRGKKTGIIDLTHGELGTRGTAETRLKEADDAAKIMGVAARENMNLKDGFFQNNEENQLALIRLIRKYRPEVVIGNIVEDRHPDHGRAGSLIYDSCFLSGLSKILTEYEGSAQEKWRPKYLFHYIQDRFYEPDIIVDISDVWEDRLNAIKAYKSQFHNGENDEPQTYISSPEFLESIIARARLLGKRIGVKFGEGFLSKKTIGIKSFDALVLRET